MEKIREYVCSAIVNVSIGLFVSLLICVFIAGGNLFWSLIPVWLFFGGTLMCFVLDSIKQIADRMWLKYTIVAVVVVAVAILLCVQYIGR
jgi:uncharacterized membrane protein YdcZ (DUF606 family)